MTSQVFNHKELEEIRHLMDRLEVITNWEAIS
jgi:hypothetical protein